MKRICIGTTLLAAFLSCWLAPAQAQKVAPKASLAKSVAVSSASRTVSSNKAKVAMIGGPREVAPLMVLMPVNGPLECDLDASLVYKLKSHQSDPNPAEFDYLAGALQHKLQSSIKEKLGNTVVRLQDTSAANSADAATDPSLAAKRTHARYVLTGTIEEVRFEGNVVLGPWYQMRLSSKLVDGATGRVMWQLSNKKFEQFHKTEPKKNPAQVMEESLLPEITDYITAEVSRVLSTQ